MRIAQFNDPDTLRAALEPGDVALVLTEPAMTNTIHLLLPEPDWHEALRAVTRQYGTLLGLDETHTHVVGPGGATGLWHLDPDMVTIGKAVTGGPPMGAYGVTAELGEQLDAARNVTGGTLFGNPLSAAAAKAALTEVLLPGAYAHTAALGSELADGIADAIGSAGLPWTVIRLGPRSGQWYGPMPRTGAQAHALTDGLLTRLIRIWLANRGYGKRCRAQDPPSPSPPHPPTWPATSRPTRTYSPSCANPATALPADASQHGRPRVTAQITRVCYITGPPHPQPAATQIGCVVGRDCGIDGVAACMRLRPRLYCVRFPGGMWLLIRSA